MLEPNELLELRDGDPLVIVESGAVQVSVGSGAPTLLGPGTVLNVPGLLKIRHEADPFKPRASPAATDGDSGAVADMVANVREASTKAAGFVGAYEILGEKRLPPNLFSDRRRGVRNNNQIKPGEAGPDDIICFYNLCPNAAGSTGPTPGGKQLSDWLPMQITGGPEGGVPPFATEGADRFEAGGAVLCAVSMKLIETLCWDADCVLSGEELGRGRKDTIRA